MGLASASGWLFKNHFAFVVLILACCWKSPASQLDGCSEGAVTCTGCQNNEYGVQCLPCQCDHFGGLGSCDPSSGECYCRRGVESRRCTTCGRQGWLGPSITSNQGACLQCFCNGYSNNCTSADEWYKASVSDYFSMTDGIEDWIDAKGGNIILEKEGFLRVVGGTEGVELMFPAKYLGDKRTMFGQQLLLTLRQSSQQHNVTMVAVEIGTTVSSPYEDELQLKIPPVAVGNNWKTIQVTTQLMVAGDEQATEQQLRRVLTNISTIALSTMEKEVTLDVLTVHMDYAKPKNLINGDATPVDYVEECHCPLGRDGQFCENCSPGYARDPPYGGPFAPCVKCYCSNKAVSCDPETGACQNCTDNTAGNHCEHCRDGYYRNLTSGVCLPCQCPGTPNLFNYFATSCDVTADNSVTCSCISGYVGDTCSICDEGYYGNPLLSNDSCKPCNCHGNANPILLMCNTTTGVCNCVHPYVGSECDLCADGFYGNAKQQDCRNCDCTAEGTVPDTVCNRTNGQCVCRQGVTGRSCDVCEEGTDNMWPDCLLCDDECYNLWNDSIFDLTELVTANISDVKGFNISLVYVSLEDFDHVCDIVDDIFTIVNRSNLSLTELDRVDKLVFMIMQQIISQMQAAIAVNSSIVNISQSEVVLSKQLGIVRQTLIAALIRLNGLQLESLVNNDTNSNSEIQQSLNKSLEAYEVISNDVQIILNMLKNNSEVYDLKRQAFMSIENQISQLLSLVDNATEFTEGMNFFLCESNTLLIDSNCSGIFQVSLITANQILASLLEVNEDLTTMTSVKSQLNEFLDALNLSLHNLSNIRDYQLPDEVTMLIDDMLNLNKILSDKLNSSILVLIESLANQLLDLSLNSSYTEVVNVTNMIDDTINDLPSDGTIYEVISRINNSLDSAIGSRQRSAEVATNSTNKRNELEKLKQKHNNTVEMNSDTRKILESVIEEVNNTHGALDVGSMTLQALISNQSSLNSTIMNVKLHIANNSQFAGLLNNISNRLFNLSVNSTQEWSEVNDTVNELLNDANTKENTSEMMRNQSLQLLMEINSLRNTAEEQQNQLKDLWKQYRDHSLRYQKIEDDVKSVRISLEALTRDISKITTANTDCINPLSGG